MANAQDKIDQQQEADDTADKANAIGKQLDIEKDDKEKLPDYEVVEESPEDERLGKERAPKTDNKVLSNREKRLLKKKKLKEKFDEKDSIIRQQQEQLHALTGRLNEIDGRLSSVDRAKVDEVLNQNKLAFDRARKDYTDAFKEGDGEKATQALGIMDDSKRNIEKINGWKQQYEKVGVQPAAAPAVDAVISNKAKAWAAKHDWYRTDGSDEDSEIAKAISGTLANEGFDPKTDDFWDELDDRLAKRGIGADEADDEDDQEDEVVVTKKRSPPVSGGSKRSDVNGKVRVTLPTAYIQHLKDKGWWDDPKMKAKMIGRYLETQKQNQQ